MRVVIALLLCVWGAFAQADPPPAVLTLEQALAIAESQPDLRAAEAQARAAQAAVAGARADLLPSLSGSAAWSRGTTNLTPEAGGDPTLVADPVARDAWGAGISASQLLFGGRSAWHSLEAARGEASAAQANADARGLAVRTAVRQAYFAAWAAREQVAVARADLANQERHLGQVEAFIAAGARPEIDRAQARADLATSRVLTIEAESAWEVARRTLDQAVGRRSAGDYDVADEKLPAVAGEDSPLEALEARALNLRPDVLAQRALIEAARADLAAERGGLAPELSANASAAATAVQPDRAALNWEGGLGLSVPIWYGGATRARIAAADASVDQKQAALDALEIQISVALATAQARVRAARATLVAATEAHEAAGERLRLAEGRYQHGLGDAVELSDAQLDATRAGLRAVQARFELSAARAALLAALGEG